MRIDAGGKTWIVEERELGSGAVAGSERFFGVTFRDADLGADVLQVRWVMRPDRLTPRVARELFEMAGIRLWRDARDGSLYRVSLEGAGAASSHATTLETARFQSPDGSVEAPWTLAKPLGCASDGELMELLDLARAG